MKELASNSTAGAQTGSAPALLQEARLVTIGEHDTGQRIDNFLLRTLKGVPKSHVYRILRSGEVRLNKGRVGPDARLATGDVLRIPPIRTAVPAPNAPRRLVRAFKPSILFEDEMLVAVDK